MSVVYYTESQPITASSGNVAAATATATLTGKPGMSTYITGFVICGGGATAASVVQATVTGVTGGTMTLPIGIPAGATAGVNFQVNFPLPIPSSALNTNIVVSVPSFGTGNTNAAVVAYGYLK